MVVVGHWSGRWAMSNGLPRCTPAWRSCYWGPGYRYLYRDVGVGVVGMEEGGRCFQRA